MMRMEERATTTYYISVPYVLDRQSGDLARETARRMAAAGLNGTVIPTHGTWEGAVEDGAMVRSQEDVPTMLAMLAADRALHWVHMEVQTSSPEFEVAYKDLDEYRKGR